MLKFTLLLLIALLATGAFCKFAEFTEEQEHEAEYTPMQVEDEDGNLINLKVSTSRPRTVQSGGSKRKIEPPGAKHSFSWNLFEDIQDRSVIGHAHINNLCPKYRIKDKWRIAGLTLVESYADAIGEDFIKEIIARAVASSGDIEDIHASVHGKAIKLFHDVGFVPEDGSKMVSIHPLYKALRDLSDVVDHNLIKRFEKGALTREDWQSIERVTEKNNWEIFRLESIYQSWIKEFGHVTRKQLKEMKKDMVDFESALSVMIDKFAVIDDVEDFIMEHHGYPMVLSADKVRDIAYRRFPYLAEEGHDEL